MFNNIKCVHGPTVSFITCCYLRTTLHFETPPFSMQLALKYKKIHQLDTVYLNIQSVFVFLIPRFLTSSCGCNFEDIDLRFFANCRRRTVLLFMWSSIHYFFS